MQFSRKRGVAILLVIAMIFSLFPKLSARAETTPLLGDYTDGVVGWVAMSVNDEPFLIDGYNYQKSVSEVGIKRLSPMYMGASTGNPFAVDMSKFSVYFTQNPSADTYSSVPVDEFMFPIESPGSEGDEETGPFTHPGFFFIQPHKIGTYYVLYEDGNQKYKVRIDTKLPTVGLYNSEASVKGYNEDTLVSGGYGTEARFPKGINSDYYFHAEGNISITDIKVIRGFESGVSIDKDTQKLTIYHYQENSFTIECKTDDDFEEEIDFIFEPNIDGFDISYADDNKNENDRDFLFTDKAYEYSKGWGGSVIEDNWVSLGMVYDDDEYNKVVIPITDISKLSIKLNGEDASSYATIKNEADFGKGVQPLQKGVYLLNFSKIGDYEIVYTDGDESQSVYFHVTLPSVGIYEKSSGDFESIVAPGYGDIEYTSGKEKTYYIVFPEETIEDDWFKSAKISFDEALGLDEIDWDNTDNANNYISFTIPDNLVGFYKDAITVEMLYQDPDNENDTEWQHHSYNLSEKKEGMMIGWSDDNGGSDPWRFYTNMDHYSKSIDIEIINDMWLCIGMLGEDGEHNPVINPIKTDVNNFKAYDTSDNNKDVTGTVVEISAGNKYNGQGGSSAADGVYIINAYHSGSYKLIYKDPDSGEEYSVRINANLPRIGIYSSDTLSEENFVAGEGRDAEYTPGKTYYLLTNGDGNVTLDVWLDKQLGGKGCGENDEKYSSWNNKTSNEPISFTIPSECDIEFHPAFRGHIKVTDPKNDGNVWDERDFSFNMRKERVGMLIKETDWQNPQFNSNPDEHDYRADFDITYNHYMSLGILTKGAEGVEFNAIPSADINKFKIYYGYNSGTEVPEEEAYIINTYNKGQEGETLPDGVFAVCCKKSGDYVLKYDDGVDIYSVRIHARMPEIAVYGSNSAPSEDDIVLLKGQELNFGAGKENKYYIQQCLDFDNELKVDSIEILSDDYDVSDFSFNKETFDVTNDRCIYELTIPKGYQKEINIRVKVKMVGKTDAGRGWELDENFCFLPKPYGFAISYASGDSFNNNKNDYEKRAQIEIRNNNWESFGIIDDEEDNAVPINSLDNISIKREDGDGNYVSVTSNEVKLWKPENTPDGVYNLWIADPGNYSLEYAFGENQKDVVYINAMYPDVMFCEDSGAVDPAEAGSLDRLNADIYYDELRNSDEGEFYINAYDEQDDGNMNFRRSADITGVSIVEQSGPVVELEGTDYEGITWEIFNDKKTATINVSPEFAAKFENAIDMDVCFQVNYEVTYYNKNGSGWVVDRVESNKSRWFHLGIIDGRTVVDFTGAAWDYTEPFTYTGTEQTVTITGLSAEVDIQYINDENASNVGTDVGEYTAKAEISLKEDEKQGYRITEIPEVLKTLVWKIVKSEDAIEAETAITALPKNVSVNDETAIKAAREAYDALSDAEKASLGDDVKDKLEAAETALETAKKAAEAAKKAAEEAAAKKAAEEAAAKKAAEEAAAKKAAQEAAAKKAAEEAAKKAAEEAKEKANKKKYSSEWVGGKWYNADGTQTYKGTLSWKCNSTGWWVEDTDGWYPKDSWQKIDGVMYYFKPDGYMATSEYYNGYWFNGDGSWDDTYYLTWKSNSTGWWVEDKSGWWPSSKWLKINGSWYYFDASGYMVTNQYVDGYWIGSDGVCC